MVFYVEGGDYDLVTPDGYITRIHDARDGYRCVEVVIDNIRDKFVGFGLCPEQLLFNVKSTLAQLGVDGRCVEMHLDPGQRRAEMLVELHAYGDLAVAMLEHVGEGAYIGKLFALCEHRRVRDPYYLSRMFGRSDRFGKPLLSLGGYHGSSDLILDRVDGRCVAYLTLQSGVTYYEDSIFGLLPTIGKALTQKLSMRRFLSLHQRTNPQADRQVHSGQILLVKTLPLHIRTVFAKVVDELLPPGYTHTSASVLEPNTRASGDIYELFGQSSREISDIPFEFYTLEPFREYVFFSDRDQLQSVLEDPSVFFHALSTAPEPRDARAATFVVKGQQLLNLDASDWVVKTTHQHTFPGAHHSARQALMVERYIQQQPSYQFLEEMENNVITSQGILLSRYFPSPLMKRMFLSNQVQRMLKGVYFSKPSQSVGGYFSHEDRAFLHDLEQFGIPVYWVDESTQKLLKYCEKPDHESGMFVPIQKVDMFMKSTLFGIYGSNLIYGGFEQELKKLLLGVLELKQEVSHALLNPRTPIALVTGGGPGVMELGNRVARDVGILSCANILDFRAKPGLVVNEQKQNPFIEAKMTYRLDRVVERQAEFHLDLPIFLMGGIGTDFEFNLELVRRKVGSIQLTPILLFGETEYWEEKISHTFQCNLKNGTIKGSEWVSNCFYAVSNGQEAIEVYRQFFQNTLAIGPDGPVYAQGFCPKLGSDEKTVPCSGRPQ